MASVRLKTIGTAVVWSMSKAFLRETDFETLPPLPSRASTLPPGARNYLTAGGATRLQRELNRLTQEERPALLGTAAEDLEAKRELQALDQRIRSLRESLRTADIVEAPSTPDGVVRFGCTVTVRGDDGVESRYRLVGVDETDLDRNWISWTSPLAQALLNAERGAEVSFRSPAGARRLKILDVAYDAEA
jgi:transcription elongation factor GreB